MLGTKTSVHSWNRITKSDNPKARNLDEKANNYQSQGVNKYKRDHNLTKIRAQNIKQSLNFTKKLKVINRLWRIRQKLSKLQKLWISERLWCRIKQYLHINISNWNQWCQEALNVRKRGKVSWSGRWLYFHSDWR